MESETDWVGYGLHVATVTAELFVGTVALAILVVSAYETNVLGAAGAFVGLLGIYWRVKFRRERDLLAELYRENTRIIEEHLSREPVRAGEQATLAE